MSLVGHWRELQETLPERWVEARIRLQFGSPETGDRAAALLGPAQPLRAEPKVLLVSAYRDGSGSGPEAVDHLLSLLDDRRIGASIELVTVRETEPEPLRETVTLAEVWDAAVAELPADWSDIYCELTLDSSDFVEPGSVLCVPLNPRRDGARAALRFRCARTFGYGASPAMARRCLERCDDRRLTGSVTVLRTLCDTHPAGTQGPVWLDAGRTI